MARPSDSEYKLRHKIKELEEVVNKLRVENEILKKKIEKLEKSDPEYKPKSKHSPKAAGGCPVCSSVIKVTDLPFGKLRICSAACGWRKVDNND